MSQVNVINVIVNKPKTTFAEPISFEIFFEALQPLKHSKSSSRIMAISKSACCDLSQSFLKQSLSLAPFTTYKCLTLKFCSEGLTWRIVYIGAASDPQFDQVLEEAEMDCSQPGQMRFVFEVSKT